MCKENTSQEEFDKIAKNPDRVEINIVITAVDDKTTILAANRQEIGNPSASVKLPSILLMKLINDFGEKTKEFASPLLAILDAIRDCAEGKPENKSTSTEASSSTTTNDTNDTTTP